ncbi:MAG TPA: hypothetical protein VI322_02950 [Candidatus Saccharimonadia bacterium]
MVCPNCHSKQIISIQDQLFCINCGQAVPANAGKSTSSTGLKTQSNGLPVGVKILGSTPAAMDSIQPSEPPAGPAKPAEPPAKPTKKTRKARAAPAIHWESGRPHSASTPASIVPQRHRIGAAADADTEPATPTAADAEPETPAVPDTTLAPAAAPTDKPVMAVLSSSRPRKRKVGRPKAGRLDVPRINQLAPKPATEKPSAEKPSASPKAAVQPKTSKTATAASSTTATAAKPTGATATTPAGATVAVSSAAPANRHVTDVRPPQRKTKPAPPAHHVHHVGVAPLHYGSVFGFALRSRAQHRHLALASLGAAVLGAVGGIGAWLALSGQLSHVANQLTNPSPKLLAEVMIVGLLYYLGRSLSQAAIIYGVMKAADNRPVGLAVQLGVAVNTFSRRFWLDLGFGLSELLVITGIGVLIVTGGVNWGISGQVQVVVLFGAYLVLLYVMSAIAIAHGLGNVALVLTKHRPWGAFSLGWALFSHRLELIGIRLIAGLIELLLALPMIAAAVALYLYVPNSWQALTGLAIGLLAWIVGASAGAGTASWWAAIYRKIVLLDHPKAALELLAGRQPAEASRSTLAGLVALGATLATASLLIPFL